jgi:hypothetical protein
MNKKWLETKTFTKNAKTNNFPTRKASFLFEFSKISCKLMKKDFFLATDATTQSSIQEENETREFFFYLIAK